MAYLLLNCEAVGQSERVLLILHHRAHRTIELPQRGSLSIGRAPESDILIAEPMVSRRHAVLHADGDRLWIEDLGSENGTQLTAAPDGIAGEPMGPGRCRTHSPTHTRRSTRRSIEPGARIPVVPGNSLQIGPCTLVVERVARDRHRSESRKQHEREIAVVDPQLQELHALMEKVAPSDIPVLLLGETGVGKEVFASRIHALSHRAETPMLKLNCGAIVESLLESELFGYERGAFTGAASSKAGLLEVACGGTVFLDEIGELPLTLQVKLLRVLEERSVQRIGALRGRPIDVRFIAATNVDLERAVASGTFRRDLYYRLNGICMTIPPLRQRTCEIEPLARLFIEEQCRLGARHPIPVLSPAARRRLLEHSWPGNIRELKNTIDRALVVATGPVIEEEDLIVRPGDQALGADLGRDLLASAGTVPFDRPVPEAAVEASSGSADQLRRRADEMERAQIVEALREAGGNQTRAAQILGLSRRALIVRLDKYDLPRPRRRS